MKAAVINEIGRGFEIEEIDIAAPVGREVLVQVRAAGLCRSDLHFAETDIGLPVPFVVGHEVAGVVAAVGPDVTQLSVGDHVVGSLIQFCGACVACLDGRTYQCTNPMATLRDPVDGERLSRNGMPVLSAFGTGGFAEQALIHENQLAAVDKRIPFAEAAVLGCATLTGVGAVIGTAGVRPGETVAVIGLGGVGLNVLSGALLAGAKRIIGIDTNDEKLQMAHKFGATDVVNANSVDAVAAVRELTGGGVDHAFEVIGLKATAEQAIAMTGTGGTAYFIGIHKPGTPIEIDVNELLVPQRRIQGVYMGSSNLKRDIPIYVELALQGRLNLSDLISSEISLHQINEAYDEVRKDAIARSVITSFQVDAGA